MSILNILKGKKRKFWKLEDRINKANEEIDSKKYLSIEDLNSLSNSIAYLRYDMNKGSLKNAINNKNRLLNFNQVDSLISKIENYRNQKYDIEINDNKYVNEINEIYNNKKLGKNKFYYLSDRLEAIDERIDKIGNDCSLKDIDSLNYILISMEKDSYMKQKSKKDKQFYETKKKLENKIKNTIYNAQKNLNQYTKSYHFSKNEIEEAKKNKVTIFDKNKEENHVKQIANEIDNEYDNQISKTLGSMTKWLKYSMIGVLGLCAYEIGSQFIENKKYNNNNVIEINNEQKKDELKDDTLLIDDFSYKNKIDSLKNKMIHQLKETINE